MPRPLIMTCALTLAVCAAPALSKKSEIVVAADSAIVAVSRDLDRQLNAAAFRQNHGDGYAIVRFERDENGRPANVTFYRRSGVSSVDRIARRAVSRLGARGGLPETGDVNQPYQANIVLATSEQSYRKLAADLTKAERQRLASRPAEQRTVAVLVHREQLPDRTPGGKHFGVVACQLRKTRWRRQSSRGGARVSGETPPADR